MDESEEKDVFSAKNHTWLKIKTTGVFRIQACVLVTYQDLNSLIKAPALQVCILECVELLGKERLVCLYRDAFGSSTFESYFWNHGGIFMTCKVILCVRLNWYHLIYGPCIEWKISVISTLKLLESINTANSLKPPLVTISIQHNIGLKL